MKRSCLIVALVLSLVLAGNALAGDRHADCTEDTQVCLNRLAAKIKAKAWLGVDLEKHEGGVGYTVTAVTADSPAEAAGFQAGDRLVALNGIVLSAENKEALKKAKKSMAPGHTASYTVKRQGAKQQIAVTLGHVPSLVMAEWIGKHMIEHHVEAVAVMASK